jgi:hypothetical protein
LRCASSVRRSAGADGFNFNVDRYTDGLDHIVDWLVPELQARGRFRTEYESTTFRGNLGLENGAA